MLFFIIVSMTTVSVHSSRIWTKKQEIFHCFEHRSLVLVLVLVSFPLCRADHVERIDLAYGFGLWSLSPIAFEFMRGQHIMVGAYYEKKMLTLCHLRSTYRERKEQGTYCLCLGQLFKLFSLEPTFIRIYQLSATSQAGDKAFNTWPLVLLKI